LQQGNGHKLHEHFHHAEWVSKTLIMRIKNHAAMRKNNLKPQTLFANVHWRSRRFAAARKGPGPPAFTPDDRWEQ
jgi:hypothetical protein